MSISKTLAFCCFAATMAALPAVAQVTRTTLQNADLPGSVQHEVILGSAAVAPGASAGKHTHPGVEVGFVLEGEFDLTIDGEGVKHLKAGDSYKIDNAKPHDVKNVGTTPGKMGATWIIEKGKPIATPVK